MKASEHYSSFHIAFSSTTLPRTAWFDINNLVDTTSGALVQSSKLFEAATERNKNLAIMADNKDIRIHFKRTAKIQNGNSYKWKARIGINSTTIIRIAAPVTPVSNVFDTTLVYFLNASLSSQYNRVFRAHLEQLSRTDSSKDPKFMLRIILIGTQRDEDLVRQSIRKILPELAITSLLGNRLQIRRFESSVFEYPGIYSAWKESLNNDSPNRIVVYAHAKGVSHIEHTNRRNSEELCASELVLERLYANLDIMNTFPFLTRLGCVAGGGGWMWFNFWMGRSDYISTLEQPIITTRRHYYEDWLCRKESPTASISYICASKDKERSLDSYSLDLSSCFSLLTQKGKPNIGQAYDAQTAIRLSNRYLKNRPGEAF